MQSSKKKLAKLGFADSKTLSESQREVLFKKLVNEKNVGFKASVVPPQKLSRCMLRINKYNLNFLSHDTTIDLIRDVINCGVCIKEIFIDTVGPPLKYQGKLQALFPGISITVSKKADSLFPVVSAASIVAKVHRDHALRDWEFEEKSDINRSFGSGYPGDPKTKGWMTKAFDPVFGFPSIIRFSWSTTTTLLDNYGVAVQWPHDENNDRIKRRKTENFFDRAKYFNERNLSVVKSFE